jgi:IS66 Orf2 like protein
MRRGFGSLARLVQESLKRDPHAGDLYVFGSRRGDLIKIIWHDGGRVPVHETPGGRHTLGNIEDGTVGPSPIGVQRSYWSVHLSDHDCRKAFPQVCASPDCSVADRFSCNEELRTTEAP